MLIVAKNIAQRGIFGKAERVAGLPARSFRMPKNRTRTCIKNRFSVSSSRFSVVYREAAIWRTHKKLPVPGMETGNSSLRTIINLAILAAGPVGRAWCGTWCMLLRRAVLGRGGLLALLLPVAELVLIVPGLGRITFLHRRRRLGLRMRPALRGAIVVLVYRALGGRGAIAARGRGGSAARRGQLRPLRTRLGTRHSTGVACACAQADDHVAVADAPPDVRYPEDSVAAAVHRALGTHVRRRSAADRKAGGAEPVSGSQLPGG